MVGYVAGYRRWLANLLEKYELHPDTPNILPATSLADLYEWYRVNLCGQEIIDPRGQRVFFFDTDFIHLIKLVNKYGEEPKNRKLAIEEIVRERIMFNPNRLDVRRTQELSWARSIAETPDMIVPNWQIMGRANPGDAYIKNFGLAGGRAIYRVLICGHAGTKRHAVTIFPRERFASVELHSILWP